MEFRDSGRTISFFSRILFQVPTIAVSTLSMIAISRNLGPGGRGEISKILLLSALASSILCTPIFLTIMTLRDSSEIKAFVSRSLFLFSRSNLALIALIDAYLLFFSQSKTLGLSLYLILYTNILIISYFIFAQIRDLLLRFHRNKIYGVDFVVQLLISGPIFILLLSHSLSVIRVVLIFTVAYGISAVYLLLVLKTRVTDFNFSNLIVRKSLTIKTSKSLHISGGFSKTGLLFQIVLFKDLLLGIFLLGKSDFGLMSALASFWVVIRFLRPSAVVQAKIGDHERTNSAVTEEFRAFSKRPSSVVYLQSAAILIMGILGYFLTPLLMGSGFKPGITMTILGLSAEILLMKCLYSLSTSPGVYSQRLFTVTCLFQTLVFGVFRFENVNVSISMIWLSSCLVYVVWIFLNSIKSSA